jgi:hypothetical protein
VSPVVAITVLLCAVIGGWLGWRRATRPVARRSLLESARPAAISRPGIDRRQRRRTWLIVITVVYALGGAALGFFVLTMLPHAAGAQTASQEDLRYCKALSEMYVRYTGSSEFERPPRRDVTADEAVTRCKAGDAGGAIPILERKLTSNGLTLPPR